MANSKPCKHCKKDVSLWMPACKYCKKFWPTGSKRSIGAVIIFVWMVLGLLVPVDNNSQTVETPSSTSPKDAKSSDAQEFPFICYGARAIGPVFHNNSHTNAIIAVAKTGEIQLTFDSVYEMMPDFCKKQTDESWTTWDTIDRVIIANKHLGASVEFGDLRTTCNLIEDIPKKDIPMAINSDLKNSVSLGPSYKILQQYWDYGQDFSGGCFYIKNPKF